MHKKDYPSAIVLSPFYWAS